MIYFFQNVFVYKRRYWLFQNVKRLTIEMIHLLICIPTNHPHPIKINNHSAKQYNSQKYLCCIFLMHSKDILLSLYRQRRPPRRLWLIFQIQRHSIRTLFVGGSLLNKPFHIHAHLLISNPRYNAGVFPYFCVRLSSIDIHLYTNVDTKSPV